VEAEEGAKPKRAPRGDPKLRMPIKNSSANGAKRSSKVWSKDEDDLLRTTVAEHSAANWKVKTFHACQSPKPEIHRVDPESESTLRLL
jgi:hypothetical protein